MKQFLEVKKDPQMSEYFASKQGKDDSDITMTRFARHSRNSTHQRSTLGILRHNVNLYNVNLAERNLKTKCKHCKILATGIQIEETVIAT